ncbi:hypothetical protein [Paenibacillus macerans]|uniref:hypothetical protein n=1 Tax=Paenibacillus macerans TaxID=44252 RepID=UPI003D32090D
MYSILEKNRGMRGMQGKILFSVFVGLMALLVLIPSSFASGVAPHSEEKGLVANQSNFMLQGSLSYDIGEHSTDIYCNGTVTVSFSPKGGSDSKGVYVAAYKQGNPSPISGDGGSHFPGNKSGSVTFKLYGYHSFIVEGDSGVTGTYKVTW